MDQRRKQMYTKIRLGIQKSKMMYQRTSFLTLTTSDVVGSNLNDKDKMDLISHSFHIFLTMLKKKYKTIETFTVITNEGNGVIHVLIRDLPFIFWKKLSRLWQYIHGSQIIYISMYRGSGKKISDYLISQYLSNQKALFRYKSSNDWLCKNFVYYWKIIRNCSRDYMSKPINFYGNKIYPIDINRLINNFYKWFYHYLYHQKERLEFI